MSKIKAYRHGEMVFVETNKIPEGIPESKTNVFAKGNTGNNHTFRGGNIYLKDNGQFIKGYFKAKNTKLFHPEHSPEGASLPDGVYELRKQSEFINGELKQVVD